MRSTHASNVQTRPNANRIQALTSSKPVDCPTTSRITGITRNTALCWDSSTLCAFADLRTIRVTAIREMDGARSSRITSQLMLGINTIPIRIPASNSSTTIIVQKDMKDTIMLSKKEARTFARKICRTESGQYRSVSSVRFYFSPTKELAAIIDADIIGIIRKNTGSIKLSTNSASPCSSPLVCID